jgi:beta-phosphoglucomutase-like phosphatase (HAD superfamily)
VGWPASSKVLGGPCISDADKDKLIDTLQDWKTDHYKDLITSGQVETRPGVLRLMDEARAAGLMVAVCSAATKSAAVTTVSSLLGPKRWEALDCFLAGNDVAKLKARPWTKRSACAHISRTRSHMFAPPLLATQPDPLIYNTACEKLGLKPSECIVIEDSTVGLNAAKAAGMKCIISYTSTGAGEPFAEAAYVVQNLDIGGITAKRLVEEHASTARFDDRK